MAIDNDKLTRWSSYARSKEGSAYDGDTISRTGPNQRLRDGNAPEKAGGDYDGDGLPDNGLARDMPGAEPAREALQQSLDDGAEVRSTGDKGFYGRDLVDVVDDQGNVGQDLIARGLAAPGRDTMDFAFLGAMDELTGTRRRPEWDKQVEQADRENLDFLRQRFEGMLDEAVKTRTQGVNLRPGAGAAAGAAWDRGIDNLQGSLYGFSEVLGRTLGVDAMAKWGEDGLLANMTQAAMNPARIADYEEAMAGGYEGVGLYVLETLIENTPQIGVDIAAALTTGGGSALVAGVGKAALRKFGGATALNKAGQVAKGAFSAKGLLTQRPGTVGMGLSIEAQMVGETRQQEFTEGLETEDDALMTAWGVGSAKAALEFAGLQSILRNVMKGGDAGAVKGFVETLKEAKDVVRLRDVVARAGALGSGAALGEGVTEMTQNFLDQMAMMGLDPDQSMSLAEIDLTELIDSSLRGAIFGGTAGTAGATGTGLSAMRKNLKDDTNQRQRDANGEPPPMNEGDTSAEPTSDLVAQAQRRGAVWLSPRQDEADYTAVIEALQAKGEVQVRQAEDGSLYMSTIPNDPLLDPENPLTGDALARAKGLTPKGELNPDEPAQVVEAVDADGNTVEAAVTDTANFDQTLAAVTEANADTEIRVRPAEEVVADRVSRRTVEPVPVASLKRTPSAPVDAELTLEPKTLGELPPSEARDRQQARATTEGETRSVFENGKLRPVGQLIADYKAGRLDTEVELPELLARLGIDPENYAQGEAAIDRDRTREALRQALASNRKLAIQFVGNKKLAKGTNYELADRALAALDQGTDENWKQAVKDAGIELKRDARLSTEKNARGLLLSRIKTKLGSDKFPRPLKQRSAERFIGKGASVDSLVGQLDQLSDNDLIGLAEAVGAPTEGLTESAPAAQDDLRGLFQAISERANRPRENFHTQEELEQEIPIGLNKERPEPPLKQVQATFDWLYDAEQRAKTAAEVVDEFGADAALSRFNESMAAAANTFPELMEQVVQTVDRRKARSENPAQRVEAWVQAWQAQLNETFDEVDSDAPSAERRRFIQQSARDISILERLNSLLPNSLDMTRLREKYWQWHWPTSDRAKIAKDQADLDAVEAQVDPEAVGQRLRHLYRYQSVQDGIDPEQDTPADQQMASQLQLIIADNPSDPETAVIEALSGGFLLGDTATTAESIMADSFSNTGTAVADGYASPQLNDPQLQSEMVFYRALFQSTLKFPEFLEPHRSPGTAPAQWSESELDYQQARDQFKADPVAFDQQFRGTLLPQLVATGGIRFNETLGPFSLESETRSRTRTNQANGANLLLVEYSGDSGPVFRLVDAIALSTYAKGKHPVNAAEALANLESNLARLVQGPEAWPEGEDAPRQPMRAAVLPVVRDDHVIWINSDGKLVTAGEARTLTRQQRKNRSATTEASQLRDRVRRDLEHLDQVLELQLLQMEQEAEQADDNAALEALSVLRFNLFEKFEMEQAGRTAEARAAEGETFKERQRLKQLQKDLTQVAAFDFGDGVIGTLKSAISQRGALLGQLKRLRERIEDGAPGMNTSLRDEQGEESAYKFEGSRNDVDEDGFDRKMQEGPGSALQVEGELYEAGLSDPDAPPAVGARVDADGNELFSPDPADQAVFQAERDEELTGVEWDAETLRNAAQSEAWQVADSVSRFDRVAAVSRGLQMPLDGTEVTATAEQPQATRPALAKNKFSGTRVRGKATKRRAFQALQAFTRRMMVTVSKGMNAEQRARFLRTPITIVQTGDIEALEQIWKDAGRAGMTPELAALAAKPGYLNLGATVVISMDPLAPTGNPAEWSLVFGHELGHMLYDQSWHLLPETDRFALFDLYQSLHGWEYNGKGGFGGFKEWFADQMSAALARDVTQDRRSQYLDANGVLGRALRFIIDKLQRLWTAIQSDKAVRRLDRFKLNLEFGEFARRVLQGDMPLSHRYAIRKLETMHYTPDEPPLTRQGIEARMKQASKQHKVTGLIRSVIGRIRSYSPDLAGRLFQSSNQQRVGDGSYEQKRHAMASLYTRWVDHAFEAFGKGKQQKAVVNQAYKDLRAGKKTGGAALLRRTIDNIVNDARERGWVSGEGMNGFTPYVFDHKAMETRRGEVFAMAKEALPKATDEEINAQLDRIIDGFGLEDLGHEPMGPGKPVGTHDAARTLVMAIGPDKLAEAGLLLDEGFGVMHHLAQGVAKRAAWESTMGGFVTKDGQFLPSMQAQGARAARAGNTILFDPNIRYKEALRTIEAEHGIPAAREVKDLVAGALGHNNLGVKPMVRTVQEWLTGIPTLMILGFSGVASIPELATPAIRAGFGLSDIMASLSNFGEAKRFAHDIGIAMTTGAEQAMRESIGEGYHSSALTKVSNVFFQVNGQQFITRLSRTVGTAIGMRYILKAAADGDYASLAKLGLTPEQVVQWNNMGRPSYTPDMEGEHKELARQVSAGVAQFVNEGTLNPNKFQAAGWGNNPYLKVIWHLKQFLWTFGDTVMMGVARQMREQMAQGREAGYSATLSATMALGSPMMAMGLMMPLAMLSLALRGLMAGDDRFDEDWDELALELTRKTGAFAQWDLIHGIWNALQWDQGLNGVVGAVVPVWSVGDQILELDQTGVDVEKSTENLKRMTPLVGQWKGTWQWLFE